jgi:glycosyltransferase involved in cell wall biosynthesis
MNSTQRNTTTGVPEVNGAAIVGRYLRYPDETGKRTAEGGLRIQGLFKRSLPDLPLVSIITVCFDSAATLEQTIQSVLAQTYANIEYLIIDAGSSDGTVDLLRKYEDGIDYFVSEPDRGLYHAMNKGLELAQGDYILILNSDDWYEQDCVESLVKARKYAGTSFVSALAQAVDGDGQHISVMRRMHFDDSVRVRMPLRHETMLIPASVYNAIGNYDESFDIIADYDLTIRMLEAGYTNYEVPKTLLYFRNTGVSNTNITRVMEERIRLFSKEFPFLSADEVALLADRGKHTGAQLLELARTHGYSPQLVRALRAYVADNAAVGIEGRGRTQWREGGQQLLAALRESRGEVTPKISVILPVHNGEGTLRACIDSILAQTLADFELICINDQTPDNSQTIIDEYCVRDPRVTSFVNESNIGLGASRNRGIKASSGAYIFHVDPDDTLPPDSLETLYRYAIEHDSDLVRGAYMREQFHHGTNNYEPEIKYPLKHMKPVINACAAEVDDLVKMPEGHWAFLYRAELARRVPYPEDLNMGQDAIFLCAVLPAASSITVIPDVVYNYKVNPVSAMNVFNFRKYMDVLEWRRRAYHILSDYGMRELGVRFLRTYAHLPWHDQFFRHFAACPDESELNTLGTALRSAYEEAGLTAIDVQAPAHRCDFLELLLEGREQQVADWLREKASEQAEVCPKVSVVVPFFKAEQTLRECIDSVLAQTLRDFELLCINDLCPDGSQAIVDEYRARDPRVVSLVNEVNIGHGASRNRGIAEARVEYIFHLDPDDKIPTNALEALYTHAVRYGSDMTKGAYLHEQDLFGQSEKKSQRKGLKPGSAHIVNTSLAEMPDLLRITEGHWSYLYKSEFAKKVAYPTDLKMGQDSIFIVNALIRARKVSIVDDVVYQYRANPDSAMNNFTFRKYKDALEWRRRAWHVLKDAGMEAIGDRLLQAYWSDAFFRNLAASVKPEQLTEFLDGFRQAFSEAGVTRLRCKPPGFLSELFPLILKGKDEAALALMQAKPPGKIPAQLAVRTNDRFVPSADLKVATLISMDHGGAGTGTQRRVAALRSKGVDARIYSLLVKSKHEYVERIVPEHPDISSKDQSGVWEEVRRRAIKPVRDIPGYCAKELFSLSDSVVDFRKLGRIFDDADLVHMHWMVGMLDYANVGEVLSDKPIAWTLADMNAFTGGCHYSEGCEEYTRECKSCHLLGGSSSLAHETWQAKKKAYDSLKNLHIICPSEWLADKVRKSSLLSNKPVHVIPNAFPVDKFAPVNKLVARIKLGLPVDKKLILFGADSVTNHRKGGDLLQKAIKSLLGSKAAKNFEALVFGSRELNLGVRTHSLGYVSDEKKLSLIYSAADVYVLPSREDNAPLTVGESLLCGTPVAGFPVGNVPEIVTHLDTGFTAEHLDHESLAQGIHWALEEAGKPDAIKRGLRCRMAAQEFHDPELAATRHIHLFRKILGKSTPEP